MIVWLRRAGMLLLVLGLLAAVVLVPERASSQDPPAKEDPPPPPPPPPGPPMADKEADAVSLPTNRYARKRIEAARDYIKTESWPDAIRLLQLVLDRPEDSLMQVETRPPKGKPTTAWVSVRAEADRLLASLPPAAREAYELRAGPKARARLNEARKDTDLPALAEVVSRYGHTRAGHEALDLLGSLHLDRGRPGAAAACFRRLLDHEELEHLAPLTLFKAALAFRQNGDTASEGVVWKQLTTRVGSAGLVLGKQKLTLEQLRNELDRYAPARGSRDWTVVRGDAGHSGQGQDGTPILSPRWQFATVQHKEAVSLLEASARAYDNVGQSLVPGASPLVAGNRVFYRSQGGVHAVDLETGKELWKAPLLLGLDALFADPGKRNQVRQEWLQFYATNVYDAMSPAAASPTPGWLCENTLLGSLSTDNLRVYAIDDLPVPPPGALLNPPDIVDVKPNQGPLKAYLQSNRLRAFDCETGKQVWELATGEWADGYFLGPPLSVHDSLYAIHEHQGEVRLVCLDPAKGDLLWAQPLVGARTRLFNDPGRHLQALHPAYADGVLVCPTNAGVVVGVDLLTRSIAWARVYRDRPDSTDMSNPGGEAFTRMTPFWKVSAPIIHEERVLFTATDNTAIHCISARDGSSIWTRPRNEGDLYVAGVFGDRVVIANNNGARAVSLKDGQKEFWSLQVGMPSGLGVAAGDLYYLPLRITQASRRPGIALLDVKKGKVHLTIEARGAVVPGNLVFHQGDLVSQTASKIMAFPRLETIIARIDERLKKDPHDSLALTERGNLKLDRGDLSGAVADLRAAVASVPKAEPGTLARESLYGALTQLLRRDFPAGEKHLDEYRLLCDVPIPADAKPEVRRQLAAEGQRRRAGYLAILASGREAQPGRTADAIDAYYRLYTESREPTPLPTPEDPMHHARPDLWAAGKLRALAGTADPVKRKAAEEYISREAKAVRGSEDVQAMERFVRVFGSYGEVGPEVRLELAERLMSSPLGGRSLEAELHLLALENGNVPPTIAARAMEMQARLLTSRSQLADALRVYRRLAALHPKTMTRDGKTGADWLAELASDKRFMPLLSPAPSWSDRPLVTTMTAITQAQPQPMIFLDPAGEAPEFFRDFSLVFEPNSSEFRAVEHQTGAIRWREKVAVPAELRNYLIAGWGGWLRLPCKTHGHLAVVSLGHVAFGLDLLDRRVLWRRQLVAADFSLDRMQVMPGATGMELNLLDRALSAQPLVGRLGPITSSYLVVVTDRGLTALDPLHGDALWFRADPAAGGDMVGDEEMVFAVDPNSGQTRGFSGIDGRSEKGPTSNWFFQSRAATLGPYVLLAEESNGKERRLRLANLRTTRSVWERKVSSDVFLLVDQPERIGVLERKGKLTVLDTRTGEELFVNSVDPKHLEGINEAHLFFDRTQVYLLLNRQPDGRTNEIENANWWPVTTVSVRAQMVNGMVYAFDRETGRARWINKVPHQFFLPDQLDDSPALLFTAGYNKVTGDNGAATNVIGLLAIDKRTGKRVLNKDIVNNGNSFFAVRADPRAKTAELRGQQVVVKVAPEQK